MSDNIKTALTGNLKVNFFKVIFGVVSIACAVIGYKKTTKNSHKVLFAFPFPYECVFFNENLTPDKTNTFTYQINPMKHLKHSQSCLTCMTTKTLFLKHVED